LGEKRVRCGRHLVFVVRMRGHSRAVCGVEKMAAEEEKRNRWLFTKEQLANSPSKAHGVDASKELSYRQQTANFIQDMGRRLNV